MFARNERREDIDDGMSEVSLEITEFQVKIVSTGNFKKIDTKY